MAVKRATRVPTRQQILSAARAVLSRDGLAALSTRAVATEAGVNLSLIHYYFGSREGLLLAMLEEMNTELLTRQRGMYARTDMSLAAKWRAAIEFYRDDLKSGYVRAAHELEAHGYSNRRIAALLRAMDADWYRLLTNVAAEALQRLGLTGVEPDEVAAMVSSYWLGMEVQHLLGVTEEESPLWRTTEKIGQLIEHLEQGSK